MLTQKADIYLDSTDLTHTVKSSPGSKVVVFYDTMFRLKNPNSKRNVRTPVACITKQLLIEAYHSSVASTILNRYTVSIWDNYGLVVCQVKDNVNNRYCSFYFDTDQFNDFVTQLCFDVL